MIRDLDPKDFAAAQAEILGDLTSNEPRLANLEAVTTLHDPGELEMVPTRGLLLRFRARRFRVPPVPYREGLQLLFLDRHISWCWAEVARWRQQNVPITDDRVKPVLRELERALTELVDLYWQLIRPLTWVDRLFWRWRENPFAHVTHGEVEALKDFFSAARRMCPLRMIASIRAPSYLQRISPPRSAVLPLAFRDGYFQRAATNGRGTPAASATTPSDFKP